MNIFQLLLIQPLANGLIFFYKILFSNLGLAIIGFSVFLRYLLNPLTKPYMNSMQKMKELAPQLEKIKIKYKNDKMKLAQAQADLYKQQGVNPSAGCLPYLLQIVVLIAFFNMFSGTMSKGGNVTDNFNKLLYAPLKFSENQSVNINFLYLNTADLNLTKPDTFRLPSIPFKLPGPILILATVVQFLSAKLMNPVVKKEKEIAKKTKGQSDDMQAAMQQSMIYTFPLMTLIFGMSFPSGLALYWLVFSVFQIFQQSPDTGKKIKTWLTNRNLLQFKIENGKNGQKNKK